MSHAGFDGLYNPTGAVIVTISFLLFVAITIFGSLRVKAAMQREKSVRDELRRAHGLPPRPDLFEKR